MLLIERLKRPFSKISYKQWIEFIAMLIGLFVDVVALLSYIGFVNTPKTSPLFYVNSQEFLVWSLIALLYALGYFNAKISNRWQRMNAEIEQIKLSDPTWMFNKKRNMLEEKWFTRRYSLALITSFPFDYLYIRAATAALSHGEASPWIAFVVTLILSGFIVLQRKVRRESCQLS